MGHGGYDNRPVTRRKPDNKNKNKNTGHHKSKLGAAAGGVHKSNNNNNNNKKNKSKSSSIKNQIRSTQRFLQRDLPAEVREAQETKLEELKEQQLEQIRLIEDRKILVSNKKIRFFERRKIERRMRRLEKQQRVSLVEAEEKKITEELDELKEDLEYVRFFPKTEKYVPLFCFEDNAELVDSRNCFRRQIKANIIAAAASGKDLTETGSEDDGPTDLTDDDFFVSGSSSDEADADDELTDLSAREQASSARTKASLGMSNDNANQKPKGAQSLMPPPRPQRSSTQTYDYTTSRNISKNHTIPHSRDGGFRHAQVGHSSNRRSNSYTPKHSNDRGFRQAGQISNRSSNFDTSRHTNDRGFRHAQAGQSSNRRFNSNTSIHSNDRGFQHGQALQSSSRSSTTTDNPNPTNNREFPNSQVSQSSNISSNSDAPKRKRKRRPKKKKQ